MGASILRGAVNDHQSNLDYAYANIFICAPTPIDNHLPQEKEQVFRLACGPEDPIIRSCLHELVEKQARTRPDAIALLNKSGTEEMTYAALDAQAHKLESCGTAATWSQTPTYHRNFDGSTNIELFPGFINSYVDLLSSPKIKDCLLKQTIHILIYYSGRLCTFSCLKAMSFTIPTHLPNMNKDY
jgi:hypothetical protein